MNNLSFDITIDRNGTVAYSTVNRAFESLAQLIQPFIIVEDGDEAEVILHVSVADIRKYNPKLEPDILRDIKYPTNPHWNRANTKSAREINEGFNQRESASYPK